MKVLKIIAIQNTINRAFAQNRFSLATRLAVTYGHKLNTPLYPTFSFPFITGGPCMHFFLFVFIYCCTVFFLTLPEDRNYCTVDDLGFFRVQIIRMNKKPKYLIRNR